MEEVKGNRRLQYLAALAANMGAFAFGIAYSYPAVALPSLREDSSFKNVLTEVDESWIGSIFALGAVASGPAAGFAIERFGRRMSMLALTFPFFLSWLLIIFAWDVTMILVGRFLTGFFSGVFTVAAPIFTAEIADSSIRGSIGATFDVSSSLGFLFIYVVGSYCSWKTQAIICALVPILILVILIFVPESPVYLLKKGRHEQAKEALSKYKDARNNPELTLTALNNLQQEVEDSKASWSASFKDLFARPILIPVGISFMIFTFQVISGRDPILVYTVDIFNSTSTSGGSTFINEYTSTIIFGVIEFLAGVVAAFFVDKTGRRFLLLVSEAMMAFSLLALGIFFFIRPRISPTSSSSLLSWLPLTSLSLYILAYSIGLGPVGYLLMGEILPLRVKGLTGCILSMAIWLLSFLATKFFGSIVLLIGEAGCFWLFAGFCMMGFVFVYFLVPETKGRSLEDIQRQFRRYDGNDVNMGGESENSRHIAEETEPLLRREVEGAGQ